MKDGIETTEKGARRRQEGGWALLATMLAICVVSVALVNNAILTCYGAAAARQSRYAFACRQAATDCLTRPVPGSDGGNLAPATPVPDWSDVVYIDPTTGAVLAAGTAGIPAGATLVERQWRVGVDGVGRRVFEVSAVALEADRTPRRGPLAARVVLSKRIV
jgi:hypothetical protein